MRFSILQKNAFKKNIKLHLTADIFERHRDNISFYFTKSKTIYWISEILIIGKQQESSQKTESLRFLSEPIHENEPASAFFECVDWNHPVLVDLFGSGVGSIAEFRCFSEEVNGKEVNCLEVNGRKFVILFKNCLYLMRTCFTQKLPYFLRRYNCLYESEEDTQVNDSGEQTKEEIIVNNVSAGLNGTDQSNNGALDNDTITKKIDNGTITSKQNEKSVNEANATNDSYQNDRIVNITKCSEGADTKKNHDLQIEEKKISKEVSAPNKKVIKLEDKEYNSEFINVNISDSLEKITNDKFIEEFPTFIMINYERLSELEAIIKNMQIIN